jgi:predicted RNA-binding Zn-ribbon protein involved in translation (DUF1610 family)
MEMVTVKTFDNYFSANILLSRLQEAGIHCFLKDEYTVTIDPILSNAIGGIKLVVNKNDVELVQSILKELDEEYVKSIACPRCGSHEIGLVPRKNAGNIFAAILTWLFASYAISAENVYQCSNCGYETASLPEDTAAYN